MTVRRSIAVAVAAVLTGGLGGCVPYAVGTTPTTVAPRETEPSVVLQAVSARRDLDEDDEPSGAGLMVGNEARLGLDERSDIGIRLIGLGSLTATYKRRLTGDLDSERGASLIVGAGLIGTSHLHIEGTLVASPGPLANARQVVPYGGVRIQDLTPFADDALATTAAVGVFAGARFGWPDLAVSPELGVFYSPSPLFRDDDLIIVPSVTVRGDRLRRALGL
ncbi:MAG: hypothetical protein AAGK21_11210 [Bacteroidota bacterium]